LTDAAPRLARLYVAFDDTDTIDADRGTGKVGRWFEEELPDGCRLWAVVRQQLLVHPDVPYTSHNSAAVCVIDVADATLTAAAEGDGDGSSGHERMPSRELVGMLAERAARHLQANWMDGSDPGLCIAWDGCGAMPALVAFGRRAAVEVVTQEDARAAAAGALLSGHGGTEDGIIGAAAGVGLTAEGWNGRLIEYRSFFGHLRDVPEPVSVSDLEAAGITVVSIDRDAPVPLPGGLVRADGWLRPRLWAGRPVLPVQRDGADGWFAPGPRTIGGAEDVPLSGPAEVKTTGI
jgi:tRNA(Ile2) C34 agmatinyltransferase TiaS